MGLDVYYATATRADRARLLDAVAPHWPVAALLEVGCNSGPVRRRLRERFGPDWDYVGIDVNEEALMWARSHAAAEGDRRATFLLMDIRRDLHQFADGQFGAVLSSSALGCLEPAALALALPHLRRIAAVAIVQEDWGAGEQVPGRGYAHDYPDWMVRA